MQGLTEGRVVHYVAYNGRHLAAMVIGTYLDGLDSCADLVVYTNMTNAAGKKNFGVQFHQDVRYSEDKMPGTWHWIERAE